MLVLELSMDSENYVVVEDEPFFLLEVSDGRVVVTRDKCPHRGGPLHLGKWNERTSSLACPWHGTCFTEMALCGRSVPSVRSGRQVTAVFPVSSDAGFRRYKRMVIANDH